METNKGKLFQMLVEEEREREDAFNALHKSDLCCCSYEELLNSKYYFHRFYLIKLLKFCGRCSAKKNYFIFALLTDRIYKVGREALITLKYDGDFTRLYNALVERSTFPFLLYQFIRQRRVPYKLFSKYVHIGFWKVDFLLAKNIRLIYRWDFAIGNEIFERLLLKCGIFKREKSEISEDREELFHELLSGCEDFYEEKIIFQFVKNAYKKISKSIDGKLFSLLTELYKKKKREEVEADILIEFCRTVMIDDNLPLKFDVIKLLNILEEKIFTDLISEFLTLIKVDHQEVGNLQSIAYKNQMNLCKIPVTNWIDRLKLLNTISHLIKENHTLFVKYLKNTFFIFFKDRVAKIRQFCTETFIEIIRTANEEIIEDCYDNIVHVLNGSRERERLSIVHPIIEMLNRFFENEQFTYLFKLIIQDKSLIVRTKAAVYLKNLNREELNRLALSLNEL